MKIYKKMNVFVEAINRIRWLFDEFPNIVCNVSGGKDSTVLFNLCLKVAREKNRLPLNVMFIDQEAEWEATIEQIKLMMYHPDVNSKWLQIPIKLFNATSFSDHWLYCWDEQNKHKWMREKDVISQKENIYNEDRFKKLFAAILETDYPNTKSAYISGVRVEESPTRAMGLTYYPCYKGITWGSRQSKKNEYYTFYPIYDWSYTDVWKAIYENDWSYNKMYDFQYRYGVSLQNMRVSNVHHETAVWNLFYTQEVEPKTYEKLTQRLQGIDMAVKMGREDYFVDNLPFMFKNWKEYRDYLLENLIDVEWQPAFKKKFKQMDDKYYGMENMDALYKIGCSTILTNDLDFEKFNNFGSTKSALKYIKGDYVKS